MSGADFEKFLSKVSGMAKEQNADLSKLSPRVRQLLESRMKPQQKGPPPLESFYEDAGDPLASFRAQRPISAPTKPLEGHQGKDPFENPFSTDEDERQLKLQEDLGQKGYHFGTI
jgi:hypothetical protein